MHDEPEIIQMPRRPNTQRRLGIAIAILIGLAIVGRFALGIASEITVKSAFYDGIGMGDVYGRRWHTNVLLGAVGVLIGLLLTLPAILTWRVKRGGPQDQGEDLVASIERWLAERVGARRFPEMSKIAERKMLPRIGLGLLALALCSSIASRLVSQRDQLFAWTNAEPFGTTDPVFGKDIGFFVFTRPAWTDLLSTLLTGLVLALIGVLVAGGVRWLTLMGSAQPRSAGKAFARARSIALVLVGLIVMTTAGLLWLSRYTLLIGGDDLVAGAGRAVRDIDIPTRTIAAILIALIGLGIALSAVPAVQRIFGRLSRRQGLLLGAGAWAAVALLLSALASPWWLTLLVVPLGILGLSLGASGPAAAELAQPASPWSVPAAGVVSAIILALLGPIGAQVNDSIVLRGSRLQVERENIAATLESTRRATGLDKAQVVEAPYTRDGVTRDAIAKAPASVASVRFLDIPPTQEACSQLETLNQFYTCTDVDVDRYTFDGKRRTVFAIGREIDYDKLPDFQRRHFTYTHGYGLVLAPVNEIDTRNGRPQWIANGIPQRGAVTFDKESGPIYFGAARSMPWSMVNTTQPVFDRLESRKTVEWNGGSGIRVGSGWRRLAITEHLGGLPFIGGGRRIWNATSGRPANADSELLLYRDITARLQEIAPFMAVDGDPYFVASGGRMYVMAPVYAASSDYPYAVSFGGVRYLRQSTMAVMDAYSGETKLYVLDESEPITKAWRSVYPKLFTSGSALPDDLRAHLRFGEAGLNVLAAATERFHVSETDVFYNGDEAWKPTEEAYGPGSTPNRIVSPIRYTYAVLPGSPDERFVAIQSYKPAVQGRGVGFSGWLAVVNDPEQYGRTVLLRFRGDQGDPLDSLDNFTATVSTNEGLSAEIGIRKDQVLRGNTIVVPVGKGLLYVQPFYLDSSTTSLPVLWKVVVGFGDGQVFAADSLPEALNLALGAGGDEDPATPGAPAGTRTLPELVRLASREFEAYQEAFGRGDDAEALRHLTAFRRALTQAQRLAERP